jgi:predicted MPP superfamily phosphohydrolase
VAAASRTGDTLGMRTGARAALGVGGAGAAGLAYASLWERNAFTLRQFEVPVLAPGAAPLRVLHISDVHMLARQQRKQAWIRDLARLLPDLVISTGDHLAGADGVAAVLDCFEPLLDRPGAFVLGSNDYYAPVAKNPLKYFDPGHKRVAGDALPWGDLVAGLTAAGWHDLTNARATLKADGRRIDLRGVDDPHLKRDDYDAVAGPVAAAADLAIGLVHAPEPAVLHRFAADGSQLLLCGHTHGGQLRLPGFGALVTNCGIDRARCRGLSRFEASWLHVSAGLGTGPWAPVRFACRPEASLLMLVAVDGKPDPVIGAARVR